MIVAKLAVYLRDIYKQCGELLEESRASEFFSSSKYKVSRAYFSPNFLFSRPKLVIVYFAVE